MRWIALFGLCFGGAGCVEEGDFPVGEADADADADTDADSDTADSAIDAGVHHDPDIQDIWDRKCGSCHLGSNDRGNLNLTDAYDQIVGVPSTDVPSMELVSPGELDESYLWHKLEGTQDSVGGDGVDMPKDKTLSTEDRERIARWILDGALR